MKQVIIIGDSHLMHDEEEHPSYTLTKKYIKSEKPDLLILNGDLLDFSYLSKFDESLFQLREGKRLYRDIEMMRKELDFFEKYSKKILYLEGNHEFRLTKRVQSLPNIADGIMSLDKLLKINYWIPEIEQPIRIENSHLFCLHGKRYTIHFAAATLRDYMVNLAMGHTHRIQHSSLRGLDKEIGCWGVGCLCSKNPEWQNGKMNSWMNGFAQVYLHDNGNFTFNNIHIIDGSFAIGGKLWRL